MQDYWKGKVDMVNVIPLDDWAGKHKLLRKFGSRNWVGRIQDSERYPCDLLWTTMAISAEGYVMYCCHDYKLLSNLSNVNEKPLGKIWKDEVSKERRKHVEKTIDKDPCLHCDAWKTRQPYFRQDSLVRIIAKIIPNKYYYGVKKLIQSITRRSTGRS